MVQKKLLNFLLTIVVLLYIVFEELIWERFAQPIITYINRLKILKKLEVSLQYVNSRLILAIFLGMFVAVEFLGLYAGALFLEGKMIHGALLYATKIPIAAFTFWLFRVTKHKLMEFAWFEKSYLYMIRIIDKIKECDIYKSIKLKTMALKTYLKEKFFKDKSIIKRKIQIIYKRLKELLQV
jgi:hypothetical protein